MSRKNRSLRSRTKRKTKRTIIKQQKNKGNNSATGRKTLSPKNTRNLGKQRCSAIEMRSACIHYDIPEDVQLKWYQRIRDKLSNRIYHNWSLMLAHKELELKRVKPYIVLATFFQYYEFDLEKSCIEENCKIFREFCQDGQVEDDDMKQLVCHLLGENTSEPINSCIDDDMALLQDLDLLILASPPDIYKRYAELSHEEWCASGKSNYNVLRKKSIQSNSDDVPSTSHTANKNYTPRKCKIFPRKSPLSLSNGGPVQTFKKFRDDKAKKLIERSKRIKFNGSNTSRTFNEYNISKVNLNKIKSPLRNSGCRRKLLNKSYDFKSSPIKLKFTQHTTSSPLSQKSVSELEDGEIRGGTGPDDDDDDSDVDDDCVLIESKQTIVNIDDDDDDNDDDQKKKTNLKVEPKQEVETEKCPLLAGYKSLLQSFSTRQTSTPNAKSSNSDNANTIETKSENCLPFFVDVNRQPWFQNTATDTAAKHNPSAFPCLGDSYENRRKPKNRKSKELAAANIRNEIMYNEVIVLDDTKPERKKHRSNKDDSVIFISESNNNNDFISLGTNRPKSSANNASIKTPKRPLITQNELFTRSEKKELSEYNNNAYNPAAATTQFTSAKRMVIIDGSNVAFKHSLDREFSVKGLQIVIEYFEKMGHEVKAVIPQFRMNRHKSTDPDELARLHKSGKIVQTPCKNLPGMSSTSYDDRFILQLASELDAAIVSNDNYRDLINENTAFKKIIDNRVIGYTWCNDIFILPKDPYGKWGPTLHSILNRC